MKPIFSLSLAAIFITLVTSSFVILMSTFLFYIPNSERGSWQFGFKEIMEVVSPIQDNYDHIYFETGHAQPHIFTLFYGNYPPAKYHEDLGTPESVEKPRKNFNFGRYVFRDIYWPEDRGLHNSLFIGSMYSLPNQDIESTENAKIIQDIYDDSGGFVARVVELK